MGVRVGIPRALWYYTYYPFWHAFFTALGATCVVSDATTKATLDEGVAACVSEACVPVKLYFGHVAQLIQNWREGRVDVLFVPRLVSWERRTVFCPKFLGLPDMVRHAWDELPPLIAPRVDVRKGVFPLLRACGQAGRQLGASPHVILRAYAKAASAQRDHARRLAANWDALRSIAAATRHAGEGATGSRRSRFGHGQGRKQAAAPGAHRRAPRAAVRHGVEQVAAPRLRLAVIGYPYLLYDAYVSLGILDKLRSMNVDVVTAESLAPELPRPAARWSKPMFWRNTDWVARAGVRALDPERRDIHGVIHVTAFSCGPDAIAGKLLEIAAKEAGVKPFLALGLDEQTGEAGCLTRLEAFVDMLRRKAALAAPSQSATTADVPTGA